MVTTNNLENFHYNKIIANLHEIFIIFFLFKIKKILMKKITF